MIELILAITVFFVSHLIPAVPVLRHGLIRAFGERGYFVFFSTLSIAVIIWLAMAFANAPYIELWPYAPWTTQLPLSIMPLACYLIVAGITSQNPFSLGTGWQRYNPDKPGIVSITRHPVIWGLILWSASHIPPNGDAAAVLMFSFFLVLCFIGIKTIEKRRRNKIGQEQWETLIAKTASIPFQSIINGKIKPDWSGILDWRLVAGFFLYGMLIYVHEMMVGVPPIVIP